MNREVASGTEPENGGAWLTSLSGPPSRTAVVHAVGMSNTALAATLAVGFFPDRPQILHPAIMGTLFRHKAGNQAG